MAQEFNRDVKLSAIMKLSESLLLSDLRGQRLCINIYRCACLLCFCVIHLEVKQ